MALSAVKRKNHILFQLVKAGRDKKIQIVASPAILEEYQRVAETLSAQYSGIDSGEIIDLLIAHAELIVPVQIGDDRVEIVYPVGAYCNMPMFL